MIQKTPSQNSNSEKSLPSSIDAEQNVLACIFAGNQNSKTAKCVLEKISSRDFLEPPNQLIFEHIEMLDRRGEDWDFEVLGQSMINARANDVSCFREVGGYDYLSKLLLKQATGRNANYYASIVRSQSQRRTQLLIYEEAQHRLAKDEPAGDVLAFSTSRLKQLADTSSHALINRITAKELDATTYCDKYIIDGILVEGQPAGICGPKKSLKTNLILDAAISISTGGKFLGYFDVPEPKRVAVMSGESGWTTIQETCRRICRVANVELKDTGIIFSDTLPKFGQLEYMTAFRRFLEVDQIEVVFVDPAYLCLPSNINAANLIEIGASLREVNEICQELGATFALAHHMKKGVAEPHEPGQLEDISWAGFQEFFRQWILVNRRTPYVPGTGKHELWFSYGGSAGHSGYWGLDISEGVKSDPDGRHWDVEIKPAEDCRSEARSRSQQRKSDEQQQQQVARQKEAKEAILRALATFEKHEATKTQVATRAGKRGVAFDEALAELLRIGEVIETDIKQTNGQTYPGYKRTFKNGSLNH